VGDKVAMLANCERFINQRCEAGGWPSYVELEQERDKLRAIVCESMAYWRHKPPCLGGRVVRVIGAEMPCTCGLDALRERAREVTG
jgi:hypothetical protein